MAIQENQEVSITYELKVNGEVVDSNIDKEPLTFNFGVGQLIPGLESRMAQMNEGDTSEILVPAAEAYGEYNEEAKQTLPKSQFEGIELSVGLPLQGQGENGQPIQVIVSEIKEEEVVIDFNHPLAGQDLTFTVTVNQIK